MTEFDPAVIAAWWHRNSVAQGLPDTIEDPVVIAKVVTLAFAGTDPTPAEVKVGADGA
jgi:hypothetical protein